MKGSSGVWVLLALALLIGAMVHTGWGCQRKPLEEARNPLDETPPFNKGRGGVDIPPRLLYEAYAADEAAADANYKGKIVYLDNKFGTYSMESLNNWARNVRVDSAGEKYFAGTIEDPKAASGEREVIRCYFYRPENPLVVHSPGRDEGGGAAYVDIIGVCVGKLHGVIVLRKCYYYAYPSGGPDW